MKQEILKYLKLEPNRSIPLVNSDYEWAEVSLFYERCDDKRTLVFAAVEFLTKWHEKAPIVENLYKKLPGGPNRELNFRRFHVPPGEGIRWYLSADSGTVSVAFGSENKELPIQVKSLAEEPRLPELVCESSTEDWGKLFCFGRRGGGSRWQYKRCMEHDFFQSEWTTKHREAAISWIKEVTDIDLQERQGLLGSLHLLLPNPLFHSVGIRGSEKEGRVFLKISPYPGQSIAGLSVLAIDQRPAGISALQSLQNVGMQNVLDFPSKVNQVGIAITCKERGLLYFSPPTPFVESIQIGMGIVSGQRKVVVPKTSAGRDETSYTVSVVGETMPISVGKSTIPSGTLATIQEIESIRRRATGKEMDQTWFETDEEERAERVIRNIITHTTEQMLIVDPYFGARELLRFALAVSRSAVPVRILTSKVFLNDKFPESPTGETNGALLQKNLQNISKSAGVNSIEVRVLKGAKKPAIHDRFLRSDSKVWLLGSSLNEFGSRGTMMIRIPDPDPIIERIEAAWSEAKALTDILSQRFQEEE